MVNNRYESTSPLVGEVGQSRSDWAGEGCLNTHFMTGFPIAHYGPQVIPTPIKPFKVLIPATLWAALNKRKTLGVKL